jgi:protein-tyrosine phosphatase
MFRALVVRRGLEGRFVADSAGTSNWHAGAAPDPRAQAAARARGVDLSGLRSRSVAPGDFAHFDLVAGMDENNVADLLEDCPPALRDRVRLFTDFTASRPEGGVPDPYYGGEEGFARMMDLIEEGVEGVLAHLQALEGGGG